MLDRGVPDTSAIDQNWAIRMAPGRRQVNWGDSVTLELWHRDGVRPERWYQAVWTIRDEATGREFAWQPSSAYFPEVTRFSHTFDGTVGLKRITFRGKPLYHFVGWSRQFISHHYVVDVVATLQTPPNRVPRAEPHAPSRQSLSLERAWPSEASDRGSWSTQSATWPVAECMRQLSQAFREAREGAHARALARCEYAAARLRVIARRTRVITGPRGLGAAVNSSLGIASGPGRYSENGGLALLNLARLENVIRSASNDLSSGRATIWLEQIQSAQMEFRMMAGEVEVPKNLFDTLVGGLMGEFNEDPSYGEIAVDTAVSLVPYADQAADIRDVVAHLLAITIGGKRGPLRWIQLGFTLAGLFPELGSILKGASKFVIRGAQTLGVGAHLVEDLLQFLRRISSTGDIAQLQRWANARWPRLVSLVRAKWQEILAWSAVVGAIFAPVSQKAKRFLEGINALRRLGLRLLDEALRRIKQLWDDMLEALKNRGRRQQSQQARHSESTTATAENPVIARSGRSARLAFRNVSIAQFMRWEGIEFLTPFGLKRGHTATNHGAHLNRRTLALRLQGNSQSAVVQPDHPLLVPIFENEAKSSTKWANDQAMVDVINRYISSNWDEILDRLTDNKPFFRRNIPSGRGKIGDGYVQVPNGPPSWEATLDHFTIAILPIVERDSNTQTTRVVDWFVRTAYPSKP